MKVRKKPLIVDAWQFTSVYEKTTRPTWVDLAIQDKRIKNIGDNLWQIKTLDGLAYAYNGDYLIQGVRQQLYPCVKEIFEETYQLLE